MRILDDDADADGLAPGAAEAGEPRSDDADSDADSNGAPDAAAGAATAATAAAAPRPAAPAARQLLERAKLRHALDHAARVRGLEAERDALRAAAAALEAEDRGLGAAAAAPQRRQHGGGGGGSSGAKGLAAAIDDDARLAALGEAEIMAEVAERNAAAARRQQLLARFRAERAGGGAAPPVRVSLAPTTMATQAAAAVAAAPRSLDRLAAAARAALPEQQESLARLKRAHAVAAKRLEWAERGAPMSGRAGAGAAPPLDAALSSLPPQHRPHAALTTAHQRELHAAMRAVVAGLVEAALRRVDMRPTRAQVAREAAAWRASRGEALARMARHLGEG